MGDTRPKTRWQAVDVYFLTAAELHGEERHRYLAGVCGSDAELHRQLLSMLRYDAAAEETLARIVNESAADVLTSAAINKRFGHYRIVRELGRGGMGSVYLAERDDAEFNKQVAIKLMAPGLASQSFLRRFRRERQILARLEHPNIARLIDAGSSDEGIPYIVMEYISGEPIHQWCRGHKLTLEERCRLFLKVCEAVAFAHRNLVVHRDLKPTNILVDEEGNPKLLDFGIAKLLDEEGADASGATMTFVHAWTPDYASPEQVMGEPVTTATDVCSLGAVLYEMLTGSRARRLTSYARAEIEREICEGVTTPPSQAVLALEPKLAEEFRQRSLASVARQLNGDLDNIVLMAMRREPERRYPSVELLAADIGRFLNGRPVKARKDTFSYRATKFVRRNRLAVLGSMTAVLCLAAGAVTTLVQKHEADLQRGVAITERQRAEERSVEADLQRGIAVSEHQDADRERDLARNEAQQAEAARKRADDQMAQIAGMANKVLLDINDQLTSLSGATKVRQEMVATTLEYLNHLHHDAGDDPRVLRVLAIAYQRLGDVTGRPLQPSLGNTKGALEDYLTALRIADQLLEKNPRDPDLISGKISLCGNLGEVYTAMGKDKEAQSWFQQALQLADKLYKMNPSAQAEGLVAEELLGRGRSLLATNPNLALNYADRSVAMAEDLVHQHPSDDAAERLASAYSFRGDAFSTLGDLEQHIGNYRKMLPMREELAARNPNSSPTQRNLMLAYGKLAGAYTSDYNPDAAANVPVAVDYYRRAIAVAETIRQRDPADRLAKRDLATALYRMGCIERPPQFIEEGVKSVAKGVSSLRELRQAAPENTSLTVELSHAVECSGLLQEEQGKLSEAVAPMEESAQMVEPIAMNQGPLASRVQWLASIDGLARIHGRLGNRERGLALAAKYAEAVRRWAAEPSANSFIKVREALAPATLADVYRELGRLPTSQTRDSDLRTAVAAYEQALTAALAMPVMSTPMAHRWDKRIHEIREHLEECRRLLAAEQGTVPQN